MVKQTVKRRRRRNMLMPEKTDSRVLLMNAVVRVVARSGMENASTRAIAAEAAPTITDTVIYRCFDSKSDMMLQTFLREDAQLAAEVEKRIDVLWEDNLTFEQRLRFIWHAIWTWMTDHKEECSFMVRYYYSACFDVHANNGHWQIWRPLSEKLQEFLPEEFAERLILDVVNVLVTTVYEVCSGKAPDSAGMSEYGFRRLFGILKEFLPTDYKVSNNKTSD